MGIKYLRQNLTIVGMVIALVLLALSYVTGYALSVTPELHVTLLGIVLLFRKGVLQIPFATWNNSRWMKWNRSFLLPALQEREDIPLLKRHMPFDRYRTLVQAELRMDDREWDREVEWSFDFEDPELGYLPPVFFSAPVRGLTEHELRRFIRSVLSQNYPNIVTVVMVVNEDPGLKQTAVMELLRVIVNEMTVDSPIKFIVRGVDPGKRLAMRRAFLLANEVVRRHCPPDRVGIAINSDPDTYLHADAVSNAVRTFLGNPQVGCVTGDVRVANANHNLLTLLTMIRYFLAFMLERASQSLFGQMYCLSGPFMAIRTDVLSVILEPWANQMFLGKECTYGDDRHLTTLNLILGKQAIFTPECIAWTEAPTNLRQWIKQQTRWARSGWRETYILVSRMGRRLHPFVLFDLAYLTFFPILILGGFMAALVRATQAFEMGGLSAAVSVLLPYALWIMATNFVFHGMYGSNIRRDWRFFLAPLYFFLWIFFLAWIKVWALMSLRFTGWGTK